MIHGYLRPYSGGAPWATMKKLKIASAVLAGALFCFAATAQDSNSLCTAIGAFEAQADVILVKGFGNIGTVPLDAGTLLIRCKETQDLSTGTKLYGLALGLDMGQGGELRTLVDDDEVDSLLNAVDYLMKIKDTVTSLPGYEALFTTKAGFRVIAHSDRKEGGANTYVQFYDSPRLRISPVQMTQLYNLISIAKKNIEALKSGK